MVEDPRYDKAEIIDKVEKGEVLSLEEEFFYLTEIIGMDPDHVRNAFTIAANSDPDQLID